MPKGKPKSEVASPVDPSRAYMKVEILHTIDCSGFTQEMIAHYRSHILPLVKRLHPDGPTIHFAFLSEPFCIEIRKMLA